jgi:hypothetical protein
VVALFERCEKFVNCWFVEFIEIEGLSWSVARVCRRQINVSIEKLLRVEGMALKLI